jgi:gamma-glutamyltranspeptidase/glutathione hydrolase
LIEFRVPAVTLQQLSERGHILQIRREYLEAMGRGRAMLHDSKTGTNDAGSDPRADGEAIPEPIH